MWYKQAALGSLGPRRARDKLLVPSCYANWVCEVRYAPPATLLLQSITRVATAPLVSASLQRKRVNGEQHPGANMRACPLKYCGVLLWYQHVTLVRLEQCTQILGVVHGALQTGPMDLGCIRRWRFLRRLLIAFVTMCSYRIVVLTTRSYRSYRFFHHVLFHFFTSCRSRLGCGLSWPMVEGF